MVKGSPVVMIHLIFGVQESATTSWATKKITVSLGAGAVWTLFESADRLVRRELVSGLVCCMASCAVGARRCLNLRSWGAIDWSDCDVRAVEVEVDNVVTHYAMRLET